MRVDAHQHFWRYTQHEFDWIDDRMASLRRDFLPADLAPMLEEESVDATIAVQARQSLTETAWLLTLAAEHDWIAGVVGWLPLAASSLPQSLDEAAANPKLKGVRHVLQGEPHEYMERNDFNAGIRSLRPFKLVYDILIFERQLPAAIRLVDRHPEQQFVLDHLAKPRIAEGEEEPWRTQIKDLARRPNVACKVSGMVTEADFNTWTAEDLRPYLDTAVEAFGIRRLIFGSDWPVCAAAASYGRWMDVVATYAAQFSPTERGAFFGGNAEKVYRLKNPSNSREASV